jgi:apolipoprotein D and lipocalin family protein
VSTTGASISIRPADLAGDRSCNPGERPGGSVAGVVPRFLRWIPFTKGDYWVLKIDDAYTVALVGTPDRKYLWLLAREPHIDHATAAAYLAEATRQGFDLA